MSYESERRARQVTQKELKEVAKDKKSTAKEKELARKALQSLDRLPDYKHD